MSGHLSHSRREVRETVQELRRHRGLFSFRSDVPAAESASRNSHIARAWCSAGWHCGMVGGEAGAGAFTSALQIMAQSSAGRGVWAVVDPARECYVPALSGWGIDPSRVLLLRPQTREKRAGRSSNACDVPVCRPRGRGSTERIPARVHRRWQLAAEVGGGVGMFFRPITARREPVWADLRLLVTPLAGGQGETRRVKIDVLYRRGGLGGSAQVWEIDHAAGLVRLVPEVADPAVAEREARA